jgi:hypothetical protein
MPTIHNRLSNPGAITLVGVDADETREEGDPISAYLFDDAQGALSWAADDPARTLHRITARSLGGGFQTTTVITYETTEPKEA